MKVEESKVTKLMIFEVERLDPIAVYLEDLGEERGKVTVTCFNDSWSYAWGAMGKGYDIRRFLLSCDEHYLAAKFAPQLDSTVDDFDALEVHAKKHVLKLRREGLPKNKARELYEQAEVLSHLHESDPTEYRDLMSEIFGDEWWYDVPKKPNHKYKYLCRIIKTVKTALAETVEKLAAEVQSLKVLVRVSANVLKPATGGTQKRRISRSWGRIIGPGANGGMPWAHSPVLS